MRKVRECIAAVYYSVHDKLAGIKSIVSRSNATDVQNLFLIGTKMFK